MKSKTFLKIGFGTLIIFLLSFLMIFILYNSQYKKEYNLWQEALKAKFFDIMDGEVLNKDIIEINDKNYCLLELKHSDFLGNSDINIYLFEESLENFIDVKEGEYLTIYCNDLELPELQINEEDSGILIETHSIIENKPIYSDLLLIAIFIGLPGTTIIFIINMILFFIFKRKEKRPNI